ncbi:MAG: metal-sensing transcriptional repressor [Coprobacillaceae bacterium]
MSNDKVLLRLKTAKGQIDAIIKMIEDDRYCIDIANQLLAVQSLIKNANQEVLSNHLTHCVKDAVMMQDADKKIEEVIKILHKM